MLNPVIMVGCGGSGSKAVRYVRDAVERQLGAAGWGREFPGAWSFIGIDLEAQSDGGEIPLLPAGDFVHLTTKTNSYRELDNSLVRAFPPDVRESHRHLIGWRPHPASVRVPIRTGAGTFRAIGRTAGLVTLGDRAGSRLRAAFSDAEARTGLTGVSGALTHQGVDGAQPLATAPLVVVCASLCGGTGAGIALDVVDLMRRTDALGADPILVLFTADIFDPVDQNMVGNSLGFVCEMVASYWSDRDAPGAGDVFGGKVPKPGHGPGAVFVVGSQSMQGEVIGEGDAHSSRSVAVYRTVGEALSSWVVDDAVQQQVIAYTKTNWQDKASLTQGGYPFGDETDQPGAVSSFGAATLGVGRERFGRWARDLLVRETIDALVMGHMAAGHFGPSDAKLTEHERIAKLAERCLPQLFVVGGEGDPGRGLSSAYHRFLDEAEDTSWIGAEFRGRFQADESMPGYEWKSQIEQDLNRVLADDVQPEGREIDADTLADWGERFVEEVCTAVSNVIAESSVAVAVKALELAQAQAEDYARDVVESAKVDRGEYRTGFNGAVARLQSRRRLKRDSNAVEAAIESAVALLEMEWELARHGAIREVVWAAVEGVYGPLIEELVRRNRDLQTAWKAEPVVGYPLSGQSPPAVYRPAPSEFVLEDPAGWPHLLDELCRQTRRDRSAAPIDAARLVLVGGDRPLGLSPVLTISDADPRWVPLEGRRFGFTCSLDVVNVEQQVTDLMGSTIFVQVLREGLGQYLSSSHRDHASRMQAYNFCLNAAVTMASPLVQLDSGLCSLLYDPDDVGPSAVDLVCSELPFGPGDPAYGATKSLLGSAYKQAAGGVDPSSVLISSFMRCPVHPMAVGSLTSHITMAVQDCTSPGRLQTAFWRWRRTRTLPSFVPVSGDMRKAMIRGFAVGRLCGYIDYSFQQIGDSQQQRRLKDVTITATPAKVHTDTVAFPSPLLFPVERSEELLPALLESFALCFANVSSQQLDAFEPFSRLHNLGFDLNAGAESSLRQVIATGQAPGPTVSEPIVEGSTIAERRASAQQYLEENIKHYDKCAGYRFRGDECRDTTGRSPKDPKEAAYRLIEREIAHEIRDCYSSLLDSLDQNAQGPKI